ncbi:Pyrimidine 5-nucleotidase [Ostreococcus tauri]|uniref:Pyrimidine 5-nucleotidase n=2 Tax=Ostreococcus tauri TaxID=70448 RepID=A0A096P832_OSTTA|nr:Pyrimidine 5-nucleotidase [Ostreococcus tauri]CEG00364.1 Pyrimidine 5-nucleotidase [Ostreococcus tauri]|eukprot:XP_003083604.2 Pyrimidine 5-nucleotidase [Ostreococcus tauri]
MASTSSIVLHARAAPARGSMDDHRAKYLAPSKAVSSNDDGALTSASGEEMKPKHAVVFFDCDDCLYKNDWRTANVITAKIESYTTERLGLPHGAAYELYKKHGTCLRGLQNEALLHGEEELEEFLEYAHDIPLEIERDERLREMLLRMKTPKWVFTASVAAHAKRCLEALGIEDLFEGIIDVRAVEWETKHSTKAYEAAMRIAGVDDPAACLFLDDSTSNMKTARVMGWTNILVGTHARDGGHEIECEHADHIISTVHDFEALMPEHFHPSVDGVEDAVPNGTKVQAAVPAP